MPPMIRLLPLSTLNVPPLWRVLLLLIVGVALPLSMHLVDRANERAYQRRVNAPCQTKWWPIRGKPAHYRLFCNDPPMRASTIINS